MKTAQALIRLVTVLMLALGLGLGTASPASADTGPGDAALQIELPRLPGSDIDDFLDALLEVLRQLLRQISEDIGIEIPLPGGDNGNGDGGDPPTTTTCPDFASLARSESPTVAFTSEAECVTYIDKVGTTVALQVVQPTTCPDFASLATAETPTVAFTSEQECITYIDAGNTPVALQVAPPDPTVTLESAGASRLGEDGCIVRVSASGFPANGRFASEVRFSNGLTAFEFNLNTNAQGEEVSLLAGVVEPGSYFATVTLTSQDTVDSELVAIDCDLDDGDGVGSSILLSAA